MAHLESTWETIERRCFDYLAKATGAVENVDGYIAEYPRTIASGDDKSMWKWELQGGSERLLQIIPNQRPSNCWQMDAVVQGVFTERATAQRVCGMLMAALPAGGEDVQGIQRLTWTAMPRLVRAVFKAQSTGADVRVWMLEWPMQVMFNNVSL